MPEQSLLRLVGFEHLHLNLTSEDNKIDESLREIVKKSNSVEQMKKRAKALERRIEANFEMIRTSSRSAVVTKMADPAYLNYISSLQVIIICINNYLHNLHLKVFANCVHQGPWTVARMFLNIC